MLTIPTDRYECQRCRAAKPASDFTEATKALARAGFHEDVYCTDCLADFYNSRLSRPEALAKATEENFRMGERSHLPGQEERKRKDLRWGHGLHSSEFINRLRRYIPTLKANPGGIQGDIALYDVRDNELNYLGYLHAGEMPEYEIVLTDEWNRPVRPIRGWRTVLLRLIAAKAMTEAQVWEEFGEPSNGDTSRFYREELQKLR